MGLKIQQLLFPASYNLHGNASMFLKRPIIETAITNRFAPCQRAKVT